MKKWMLFIGSLFLIVSLTACSEDNNSLGDVNNESDIFNDSTDLENEDPDNESDTEKGSENNDMQAKMDILNYKKIEIEVEYANDKEYEIEIEQETGKPIKAEIEDELNNVFLEGEEAFNKLYPLVKELSIDKNTTMEDAIQDVLKVFNLEEDYEEFELEITFKDGGKLEYKDK